MYFKVCYSKDIFSYYQCISQDIEASPVSRSKSDASSSFCCFPACLLSKREGEPRQELLDYSSSTRASPMASFVLPQLASKALQPRFSLVVPRPHPHVDQLVESQQPHTIVLTTRHKLFDSNEDRYENFVQVCTMLYYMYQQSNYLILPRVQIFFLPISQGKSFLMVPVNQDLTGSRVTII